MSILQGILPNNRRAFGMYQKVKVTVSDVLRPSAMPITQTFDISIPSEMARFLLLLQSYNCVTQLVGTVGAHKHPAEVTEYGWMKTANARLQQAAELIAAEAADEVSNG